MSEKLEIPKIEEIVSLANLLDSIGDYKNAELLDKIIEEAFEEKDLIKRAGFFGNIFKRMTGWLKKVFVTEYKELYESAQKSQSMLDEKVSKINEEYKKSVNALKNYELGEWRQSILSMEGLNTDDVLAEFQQKYGKFVEYITSMKKMEEKGETPKTEFERMTENIPKTEEKTETIKPINLEWRPVISGQKSVQINEEDSNRIRIDIKNFNRWRESQIIRIKGDIYKYNEEYFKRNEGKTTREGRPFISENLLKAFDNFLWKITSHDDQFVYFEKIQKNEEKEEVIKEDEVPDFPEPKPPIGTPPPGFEVSTPKGSPILSTPGEVKFETVPQEEVKFETVPQEEVGKTPDGIWVKYKPGTKHVGKYSLVNKINPKIHERVVDKQLEEELNKEWERSGYKKKLINLGKKISSYKIFNKVAKLLKYENDIERHLRINKIKELIKK